MTKTALVSGGSRGIGAAIVRRLTTEGIRTAFFYRNSASQAEALARETGAMALCADVSDMDAATQGVQAAKACLGHIDCLINNAGIAHKALFQDMTKADWDGVFRTNLDSVFFVTKCVLPEMIARQSGAILNISSMWGVVGASCESAYAASKAGVISLTRSLAKELGPSGIRVNAIAPGLILTDMNRDLDEDTLRAIAQDTPLQRNGVPDDIAHAAFFLLSDQSTFITGQVLTIDGGFTL